MRIKADRAVRLTVTFIGQGAGAAPNPLSLWRALVRLDFTRANGRFI